MTREPYRPTVPELQPHYAEIADLTSKHAGEPPPPYTSHTFTNEHGKRILRLHFNSALELENFFVAKLIGSDMMKGRASKVIGTTLLVWDRN